MLQFMATTGTNSGHRCPGEQHKVEQAEAVEAGAYSSTPSLQGQKQQVHSSPSCWSKLWKIYNEYEFLILIVIGIVLAKLYPPLGAYYLVPQITATWIAVIFIFVIAGLDLRTNEFQSAFSKVYFNLFVQLYNFGFVSAVAHGFSRLLLNLGIMVQPLADGMTMCACLPMAINMVLILTKSAHGDEAAAIFNAAFSNTTGVFISPLLILAYLGVRGGDVDLVQVFFKLVVRIVLPLIVGQVLQKTYPPVVQFMKAYKVQIKKSQIYALVFIVYTVFCTTFSDGNQGVEFSDIVFVMLFQALLLGFVTVVAWSALQSLFREEVRLRVMGLFGCTQKTVSVGVPLITAMYEGNDNLGLYTLPLLIWHPMQLVLGSLITPQLIQFVEGQLGDDVNVQDGSGNGEVETTTTRKTATKKDTATSVTSTDSSSSNTKEHLLSNDEAEQGATPPSPRVSPPSQGDDDHTRPRLS